jgi:hypothetical protein
MQLRQRFIVVEGIPTVHSSLTIPRSGAELVFFQSRPRD